MEAIEAPQIKAWCCDRACFDALVFSCYLRPAPHNQRAWLLRRQGYAFRRLRCVRFSCQLIEPGFRSISNFQRCCDVLRFFEFVYYCCKYVTSMIICASGFYTVVCTHSSKTPSWYCLLHLLYTKDTNALPALQVETPTAPPPSGPAQVRCRHFRFQSVAMNKKAQISLRYLSQFTRQKKEKEKEKKEAVQCRKPEPQRFN